MAALLVKIGGEGGVVKCVHGECSLLGLVLNKNGCDSYMINVNLRMMAAFLVAIGGEGGVEAAAMYHVYLGNTF